MQSPELKRMQALGRAVDTVVIGSMLTIEEAAAVLGMKRQYFQVFARFMKIAPKCKRKKSEGAKTLSLFYDNAEVFELKVFLERCQQVGGMEAIRSLESHGLETR